MTTFGDYHKEWTRATIPPERLPLASPSAIFNLAGQSYFVLGWGRIIEMWPRQVALRNWDGGIVRLFDTDPEWEQILNAQIIW